MEAYCYCYTLAIHILNHVENIYSAGAAAQVECLPSMHQNPAPVLSPAEP